MSGAIQRDHELVCQNCGCVVGEVHEYENSYETKQISISPNLLALGSALERNVKYNYPRSSQQAREEITYTKLIGIVKKYGIPDFLAYETFKELKKKNRGFWSETEPIKQLIKILSKDDYYPLMNKKNKLKADFKDGKITSN